MPFDLSLLPSPTGSVPQPPGKALTGRSLGPSSALPGDPYNPAVGTADFTERSPSASSDSGEGTSVRGLPWLDILHLTPTRAGEFGASQDFCGQSRVASIWLGGAGLAAVGACRSRRQGCECHLLFCLV